MTLQRSARRQATLALALVMGLIGGCHGGVGFGGASGAGGDRQLGGAGGSSGLGGGGVDTKRGWCRAETIDVGETFNPMDIDLAVGAGGDVFLVWRDHWPFLSVWSTRWTPEEGWGTAEPVQPNDAPAGRPRVAIDGSGSAVVVWTESDCVSTNDVWARRWTRSEGWGAAALLDTEDGWPTSPEVAVDSSGNAVVVWTQSDAGGGDFVWSSRWTRDTGWATPERIRASDSQPLDARVAVVPDGTVVATWRELEGVYEYPVYELWLNHWTPGEGWSAPERSDAAVSVDGYDVAVDPSGDALAVWPAEDGLWSTRWTGAWEPPVELIEGPSRHPQLVFEANGGALVTWKGGRGVLMGRWRGSGPLTKFGEVYGGQSDLAVDRTGNALLLWEEDASAGTQVLARWWTPGTGWGDVDRIESKEGDWQDPQVGVDADGNAMAIWFEEWGALRASRFQAGCANDLGTGGGGGEGGFGGAGGAGGDDLCDGVVCPDTECRSGGACDPDDGTCTYAMRAADGSTCSEGECLAGGCGRVGAFSCTEQGIRDAISEGGGPHFFACDEAMPVTSAETIHINNDVILDGEGELFIDAFVRVEAGATAELRAASVRGGPYAARTWNYGSLTLVDSSVTGVVNRDGEVTLINTALTGHRGIGNFGGVVTLTGVDQICAADSDCFGILNVGGLMTITDSTISGVAAVGTAAVSNSRTGILSIENTSISGTTGAAIHNDGTMTLTNSTVANNTVERGAAIQNGICVMCGTMTVINSTVSSNAVSYACGSHFNGYGIGNRGTLTIINSTLAGNASGGLDNRGEATVTNSVIDGGCVQFDADAATVSGGYNVVVGDDACGLDDPTDQIGVSSSALALGPLADNGGPTMTHALLPASVAIDTIPGPMCEVAEDQRGEPRSAGAACDAGAFEAQGTPTSLR